MFSQPVFVAGAATPVGERRDRQTDTGGSRVPPSTPCSPGASLGWFALAGSVLSQPCGLGMGREHPMPVVSPPFPSPGGLGMSWGGRDRVPQEQGHEAPVLQDAQG